MVTAATGTLVQALLITEGGRRVAPQSLLVLAGWAVVTPLLAHLIKTKAHRPASVLLCLLAIGGAVGSTFVWQALLWALGLLLYLVAGATRAFRVVPTATIGAGLVADPAAPRPIDGDQGTS